MGKEPVNGTRPKVNSKIPIKQVNPAQILLLGDRSISNASSIPTASAIIKATAAAADGIIKGNIRQSKINAATKPLYESGTLSRINIAILFPSPEASTPLAITNAKNNSQIVGL